MVRQDSNQGCIRLDIAQNPTYEEWGLNDRTSQKFLPIELYITNDYGAELFESKQFQTLQRHVWGGGKGWFSASYGPFRRFMGGDVDFIKLSYSYPKLVLRRLKWNSSSLTATPTAG